MCIGTVFLSYRVSLETHRHDPDISSVCFLCYGWYFFKYINMYISYTCILIYACGVMVIVIGNGHVDMSSNPGREWLHFT